MTGALGHSRGTHAAFSPRWAAAAGWRALRFGLGVVLAAACAAASAGADVLQGVVRTQSGAPVAGADFDVLDAFGEKLPYDDGSDPDGTYEIVLPPGVYDVECEPPIASGLAPQVIRGVRIEGVVTLDWTLPPALRVLGRVMNAAGSPVSQARIEFDRADDGTRQPSSGNLTNVFGSFAAWVAAGTYRVTALPPEADTVLAPARLPARTLTGADTLRFTLVAGSHLSGTVRDDAGLPVAGARLSFDRAGDGARVPAARRTSDAAGFVRACVEPGVYRVTIEPPRGAPLVARRLEAVDLAADALADLALERGAVVSGRVTGPDGFAVAGGDWDVADENTGSSVPTPWDATAADGSFALVLAPGRYRLTLVPPAGSSLDTLVLRNVAVARDTVLDVRYGTVPPPPGSAAVRLAAIGSPGYRRATVSLALARPGVTRVEVFSPTGRRVRTLWDGWLDAGAGLFDWDARDASGNLARTGVYFVRAQQGADRDVTRVIVLP